MYVLFYEGITVFFEATDDAVRELLTTKLNQIKSNSFIQFRPWERAYERQNYYSLQ